MIDALGGHAVVGMTAHRRFRLSASVLARSLSVYTTATRGARVGAWGSRIGSNEMGKAVIYKILTRDQWRDLAELGETAGAPIDRSDGYIHFSTADQLAETATRHFAGQDDLVLVAYDPDRMPELRWEPSRGGALFPHLYAPLRSADRLWVTGMPLGGDGSHVLPNPLPGASEA